MIYHEELFLMSTQQHNSFFLNIWWIQRGRCHQAWRSLCIYLLHLDLFFGALEFLGRNKMSLLGAPWQDSFLLRNGERAIERGGKGTQQAGLSQMGFKKDVRGSWV